jgi:hypothetical protein
MWKSLRWPGCPALPAYPIQLPEFVSVSKTPFSAVPEHESAVGGNFRASRALWSSKRWHGIDFLFLLSWVVWKSQMRTFNRWKFAGHEKITPFFLPVVLCT